MDHTPLVFYIFLLLTVFWFIFMTYLSHQDGEHTGKTGRKLAEKLSFLDMDVDLLNSKLRRATHVVVFAVFTILLGIMNVVFELCTAYERQSYIEKE